MEAIIDMNQQILKKIMKKYSNLITKIINELNGSDFLINIMFYYQGFENFIFPEFTDFKNCMRVCFEIDIIDLETLEILKKIV